MARIPPITERSQLAPEHQGVWDRIGRRRGHVAGPFSVLLHSPEVAGRTGDLGAYIRFESKLAPRDRELAVLTVAREMDCGYEWAAHVPEARRAGLDDATIRALRDRRAGELPRDEALVVVYARALLTAHRVDAQTFERVEARLGAEGLVELTATIGYYAMLACTLNAFEVTPDGGDELLRLPRGS